MYYFVIPFTATINGDMREMGTAGVISQVNDYRSNAIKTAAIEFYQRKFNTKKAISVSLIHPILPYAENLYSLIRSNLTFEIIDKGYGLSY